MNFKTTYVLFGIFAAVLVVFGVTQLLGLQSPKDKSVYALPSLHDKRKPIRSEDIGTVQVARTQSLLAESSFDIVSAKLQEPKHELIDLEKSSDGKWRFEKPAFGEADFEG